MSIFNIIKAVRNFFRPQFTETANSPYDAANSPYIVPSIPKLEARSVELTSRQQNSKRRWLVEQIAAYDGSGRLIVKLPSDMDISLGQQIVASYICSRFGQGKFKTRRFHGAHTIHVNPK